MSAAPAAAPLPPPPEPLTAATSALLWEATFDDDASEGGLHRTSNSLGGGDEEAQDHEAPSPSLAGVPAGSPVSAIEESGGVPVPAVHDNAPHANDATEEEAAMAASTQASGSGAMTRRPESLSPDKDEEEEQQQKGQEGKSDEEPRGVYLTEQHRVAMFKHLLASEVIDEARLKDLAGNGIPDVDKHLRPLAWRLLLSHLPYDQSLWESHLQEQRAIYHQFAEELTFVSAPPPLSSRATTKSHDYSRGGESASSSIPFASPVGELKATTSVTLAPDAPLPSPRTSSKDDSDMSLSRSTRDQLLTRPRSSTDQKLFDDISKDVVRTHPDQYFFLDPMQGLGRYDALLRILFVYAKINVGVLYIQGMNELAGTLLYVLASDSEAAWAEHAEADTFFCFTHLMSSLRDVFIEKMDESDTGIEANIQQLATLLARHDPALAKHFQALGLDAHYYSLRWITTLFCRELTLPDSISVWDALLADAKVPEFVLFFCLSMLLEQREELLRGDFAHDLRLLQNYPPEADVKRLLQRMRALRSHDARCVAEEARRRHQSMDEYLQLPKVPDRVRHLWTRIRAEVHGRVVLGSRRQPQEAAAEP